MVYLKLYLMRSMPAESLKDDSEKEVTLEFTLKADSETLYKVVRKGKKKYDYRFAVTETI